MRYFCQRTKWKRQAAVGMDLLNEASNVAAIQQLLRTNPYWANYMAANSLSHPRLFPLQATAGLPLGIPTGSSGALPIAPLAPLVVPPAPMTPSTTSASTSNAVIAGSPVSSVASSLPLAVFPFQVPNSSFTLNLIHSPSTAATATAAIQKEQSKTPPTPVATVVTSPITTAGNTTGDLKSLSK
ncbi:unnamed protein product [Gongylonema pulchrum]|uniref:Uncharacterized protein n=1 Tax=Gongylonema pulchrum TaxID=637853 RepID=A0A183DG28_9BILA|nr:unnamed protein product [Gongylonema pulchrum]